MYGLEVGIFQLTRSHSFIQSDEASATGGEISHRRTGVIAGLQIDAAPTEEKTGTCIPARNIGEEPLNTGL